MALVVRDSSFHAARANEARNAGSNTPAEPEHNWLGRLMARRPRTVVAVALANKMARIIWAMMTREENYRLA
jgi:transposase